MKTRCLAVSSRPNVGDPLAASLSGSDLEVDLCATSEEITRCLNESLPDVILIDLHEPMGLGILALAESLRLRVPVLVLRQGTVWSHPLPFPLSPFLRIYSLESGEHEWRSQIAEARRGVQAAADGSMFQLSDYVQLAVLTELSVALHGKTEGGVDLLVEIVGGDVWNAFAGEAEGETALVGGLRSTPRDLEVSLLLSVPGERQMRSSGWELLGACAQKVAAAISSRGEPWPDGLGTRPISLPELRGMMESEKAAAAEAPETKSFDALLERGFASALARDYESAVEAFEKALELRPDDTRVQFNLDKVRKRLEGKA